MIQIMLGRTGYDKFLAKKVVVVLTVGVARNSVESGEVTVEDFAVASGVAANGVEFQVRRVAFAFSFKNMLDEINLGKLQPGRCTNNRANAPEMLRSSSQRPNRSMNSASEKEGLTGNGFKAVHHDLMGVTKPILLPYLKSTLPANFQLHGM